MRLADIILEGRDAPLYHGTSLANATKIMKTYSIDGSTMHRIDGVPTYGVSLTRSKQYAFWWANQESDAPVVFELDQAAIAARHKIIPFDIYGDGFMGDEMVRREAEEFVIGNLRFTKFNCLRAIWMRPETVTRISKRSPLYKNDLVKVIE